MSDFQTYYQFKLDFQKADQHTGGKWLIHGTKRRKDYQLQNLEDIPEITKEILSSHQACEFRRWLFDETLFVFCLFSFFVLSLRKIVKSIFQKNRPSGCS